MTDDVTGHEWYIGRFQADDESYCRLCGIDNDDPRADEPCDKRASAPAKEPLMDKDKLVERLEKAAEHGEKYGALFLATNEIWADIRAAAAALRSHAPK